MSKKSVHEMFKELVNHDIIVYGGGNGKSPFSFSAGVQYSETFARCYTGVQTINSFDELKDLYELWRQYAWVGVVAWLSKKEGCLPLKDFVRQFEEKSEFRFSSLNLPPHSMDEYDRILQEEGIEAATTYFTKNFVERKNNG